MSLPPQLARLKSSHIKAELRRRAEEMRLKRAALFTLLAVADGHIKQLKLMEDRARYILALCSRRAGKTYAMATILIATARDNPGSNSVYIALTRGQAKRIMWTEIWKPLCDKWGVDCKHNEADLATTFANGSHVYFSGTDDVEHIKTQLGSKLTLAIIDECQSQKDSVLEPLVKVILPPALSDVGGRLILAGTIPESPAGFFWRSWISGRWSMHNWSRFDNPHLLDQQQMLADFLALTGLDSDDPLVLRDWYGQLVFDPTALAFRYVVERNGFPIGSEEVDPEGKWIVRIAPADIIASCTEFSVGGDPGTRDRSVLEVNGWSTKHKNIFQVYEWATKRNAMTAWSGFGPRLDQIQRMFAPSRHFVDFSGSQMTLDNFRTDFGVYVLHAAKKVDRKGQVDRVNDLLQTGRAHAMIGSDLEGDWLKTQWDKNKREKGLFDWSSHNHPDAADADRYSKQGYFDAFIPPEPPKPEAQRYFDDAADKPPWFERDMQDLLPDEPSPFE